MEIAQNFYGAPELSVVVPVYNFEAVLDVPAAPLIPASTGIFQNRFEIALVNDGSKDTSWQAIFAHGDRGGGIVRINSSQNYVGYQLELTAGLRGEGFLGYLA